MSFVFNGITYIIASGSTVVVGSNLTVSGAITIPNQVTNNSVTYTVVEVIDFAFTSNSNITSIDFSECSYLTIIGNFAFESSSIQSIKFPSSITNIGNYAFGSCYITLIDLSVCHNLTTLDNPSFANSYIHSVIFPSSIDVMTNACFSYCSQLKNITFTGPLLPYISGDVFDGIPPGVIAYMTLEAFKNPLNSDTKSLMITYAMLLKILQSQMVCFKEDSTILTIDGYKPIQDLRKGDLIKTANNDFKPIELIGKQSRYHPASTDERIKDQLYRCSQTHFPEVFDDLIITGCHSILVDELTEDQIIESTKVNGKVYITEGKYRLPACVDERTQVYEHPGMYTIYHLALENEEPTMNYGIYANGLLVETCSIRFMKELSMLTLLE